MVGAGEASYRQCLLRALPLAPRDLLGRGRWLIIAPHPDDETLGCGGLLHALAAGGGRPFVVYLTDGAASHTGSREWPRQRLATARRNEAIAALRVLGVPKSDIFWLDWPDGKPHSRSSRAFDASRRFVSGLCRTAGVRSLASTWRGDPHCDHAAAFELAQAAASSGISLYEYIVWGWTTPDLVQALAPYRLFRVDVHASRELRKRALAKHRTQVTTIIEDATFSFRLPLDIAALTERRAEILVRSERAHAA